MNSREQWLSRLRELAELFPTTKYEMIAAVAYVDNSKKTAVVYTEFQHEGFPDFLRQRALGQTFWAEEEGVWQAAKKRTIRGGGSWNDLGMLFESSPSSA